MEENIHEKLLKALEKYDDRVKTLILNGIDFSYRTGSKAIADKLYSKIDRILKGDDKNAD
jgi:hypothetical protein